MINSAQERQHIEEALGTVLDLCGEEARPGVRVNFPEKIKEMFTDGDNQIFDIENKMVRALSRITRLPQEKLTIAEAADELIPRVIVVEMPTASARDALAVVAEASGESIRPQDVLVGVWEDGSHFVLGASTTVEGRSLSD